MQNIVEETSSKVSFSIGSNLGQGSVYKVIYQNSDGCSEFLACKILDKTTTLKDFSRELEILKKIKHDHIIRIYRIIEKPEKVFLFTNYAENGDLYRYLKTKNPLSEKKAGVWFKQIAYALNYLHCSNIAHCNLKCENILITQNKQAMVTGFKLSRFCKDNEMIPPGDGSIDYSAPEIIAKHWYQPKIADIWSLGVVLYMMLYNRLPFNEGCLSKQLENQMSRNIPLPDRSRSLPSIDVKSLLCELLEPDVHLRAPIDYVLEHQWIQRTA